MMTKGGLYEVTRWKSLKYKLDFYLQMLTSIQTVVHVNSVPIKFPLAQQPCLGFRLTTCIFSREAFPFHV